MVWNRSHTASDIINMLDAFRRDLLHTTANITRMLPNVPTATTITPKVAPVMDAACDRSASLILDIAYALVTFGDFILLC